MPVAELKVPRCRYRQVPAQRLKAFCTKVCFRIDLKIAVTNIIYLVDLLCLSAAQTAL